MRSHLKYHNKPCRREGMWFASGYEAEVYMNCKALQNAGVIWGLDRQVAIPLMVNGVDTGIVYKADIVYYDSQGYHILEAKGYRTDLYKLKKRILEINGIIIEEV